MTIQFDGSIRGPEVLERHRQLDSKLVPVDILAVDGQTGQGVEHLMRADTGHLYLTLQSLRDLIIPEIERHKLAGVRKETGCSYTVVSPDDLPIVITQKVQAETAATISLPLTSLPLTFGITLLSEP